LPHLPALLCSRLYVCCRCRLAHPFSLSFPSSLFVSMRQPRPATLFPYTTLFRSVRVGWIQSTRCVLPNRRTTTIIHRKDPQNHRSEEHTSELQSRFDLVCRLLLEKKKRDNHPRQVRRATCAGNNRPATGNVCRPG